MDFELGEMKNLLDSIRDDLQQSAIDETTYTVLINVYKVFLLMERRLRRLEPIVQVLVEKAVNHEQS